MFFGGHFNLRKFLLGFFILRKQWHANFLLLCISFFLCMDLQPYSHNRFSKISRTFYASRKSWIIVVFLLCTLKEKLLIFLINTLLLHIPLLALTDGQNYRETDRITEEWIHLLRVGWRKFFPIVLLCQFLVLVGNRFWLYILRYLEYITVVALC
jgi:hypothetical protein